LQAAIFSQPIIALRALRDGVRSDGTRDVIIALSIHRCSHRIGLPRSNMVAPVRVGKLGDYSMDDVRSSTIHQSTLINGSAV
jgi:hypothetical protein